MNAINQTRTGAAAYSHYPQAHSQSRLCYSVEETASLLGICRDNVYRLLKLRELKALKLGKRTVIRGDEIERFLDNLPAATLDK